jgi:poly-gamma-glutamate capsule biosynthesis protein CapA/YwtB (metallophosphatase superfamily)
VKLALAGDTMLGRGVAERLATAPPKSLFAPEVVAAVGEADLCILNLECSISERGARAAGKTFHFRAPPIAVEVLANLGVDCVTLANNHALDFGPEALLDTFVHLGSGGIAWAGAGPDIASARAPVLLEAGGSRLGILALTDHPDDYAAGMARPGVAYADLAHGGVPDWVVDAVAALDADAILVTPHWGWNMRSEPMTHVRAAARAFLGGGATLVAGHSAHVFHGVAPRVLYDLGDFLDDYQADRKLRNDLGLLFLVDLASGRLEAIPLKLEFAHTRFADGEDAAWIRRRFADACAAFGTAVTEEDGRLVCAWR